MNYENLKDAIVAVIKQNGNEEITGDILQQVLVAMVNSLGSGYQFRGIATPETNPGTPDQRVFYLASATGTYSDFGFIVSDEICALVYDTAWHKQTIIALDQEPTEDSGNLISSGAIYTALQNLADVFMELVEDADEDHIATFDENGQVKDSGLSLDDVAKAKGSFPELFAGFAGNLVDTRSAGTRQQFAFRQSGGDGVDYMVRIKGKTEAFNQLVQNGDFASVANWLGVGASYTVAGNVATVAKPTAGGAGYLYQDASTLGIITGHKYYYAASFDLTGFAYEAGIGFVDSGNANIGRVVIEASGKGRVSNVFEATAGITGFAIRPTNASSGSFKVWDVVLIDLTREGLGLTTADQFRALHPLPYYNYNAGVLKNNAATGIKSRGFNQWDEETVQGFIAADGSESTSSGSLKAKNYCPCLPNTTYYAYAKAVPAGALFYLFFYDANKTFISRSQFSTGTVISSPSNAAYFRPSLYLYGTTYNHDICINLSDASRNGEYEPYWERTLALGLNSIPCHDENNNAVVVNGLDGVGTAQDELIVDNGWGTKINKKMAEVDLGSLSWDYIGGANARFKATLTPAAVSPGNSNMPALVCSKYAPDTYTNIYAGTGDKQTGIGGDANIYVRDTAYSNAGVFTTAMSGVKLRYELATPLTLTVDTPFPAFVEVDNLGTQERLPADTAADPQGPFECDSNYSISTANLVRKLSEL